MPMEDRTQRHGKEENADGNDTDDEVTTAFILEDDVDAPDGDTQDFDICEAAPVDSLTAPADVANHESPPDVRTKCQTYGMLVGMFLLVLFVRAENQLMSSFYPTYAIERNVTEQGIGLIFGSLDFAKLVSCFIWGQLISSISVKVIYIVGVLGLSTFCGLFAVLAIVNEPSTFLITSIVLRIFNGLFSGALFVSESTILLSIFPNKVGTVIGLIEAAAGLGFLIGPPIGGALYQYGDFYVPFLVIAFIILVVGLLLLIALPPSTRETAKEKTKQQSYQKPWQMVKIPVFLSCLLLKLIYSVSVALTFSFIDLKLGVYNLTPVERSCMIIIGCVFYTLFTVITGRIIDTRPHWKVPIITFTFSAYCIITTIYGPAPYYNIIDPPLWLVGLCLGLMGMTASMGVISFTALAYQTVKEADFADGVETYGSVAGFLKSTEFLGYGLGSVVGGAVFQAYGWEWMQTGLAYAMAVHIVVFLFSVWFSRSNTV